MGWRIPDGSAVWLYITNIVQIRNTAIAADATVASAANDRISPLLYFGDSAQIHHSVAERMMGTIEKYRKLNSLSRSSKTQSIHKNAQTTDAASKRTFVGFWDSSSV